MAKGSILHFVTTIDMGGIEILVRDLSAEQRKAGYQVSLCCLGGHTGVLAADFARLGVDVYCVPYGRWSTFPAFARDVARVIRRVRPGIVHVHTEALHGFVPVFMARLSGVRSLVRSIHLCVPVGMDDRLRLIYRRLELSACVALGTRLVGVSADVRHEEAQRVGIPETWFTVIENGLDLERFGAAPSPRIDLAALIGQETPRADVFLVLCVARLQPQKNHAMLVRALAELVRRACPREPHLLLAGVGELEADLRRLIRELSIERHIHFLGMRRDVPALLAEADVFAMSSDYEGFGICVAEAMAAGKPVVATAVPGLKSVVVHGHTGLLTPPRDPQAFADALERLLRDPALGHTMGSAARARAADRYSLWACARAYEALYQRA